MRSVCLQKTDLFPNNFPYGQKRYNRYLYFLFLYIMQGTTMNLENAVNEGKSNQEQIVPTVTTWGTTNFDTVDQSNLQESRVRNDGNILVTCDVDTGDQSQVSASHDDQNPANVSVTSLVQAKPSTCAQRMFGRKRPLTEANDSLHVQADNASMIQSF